MRNEYRINTRTWYNATIRYHITMWDANARTWNEVIVWPVPYHTVSAHNLITISVPDSNENMKQHLGAYCDHRKNRVELV